MRVGTQTLIQALQALPWSPETEDDDALHHDLNPSDSDSDDEPVERAPHYILKLPGYLTNTSALALSSSIHTIYRPVARSRLTQPHASPALIQEEDAEGLPMTSSPVQMEEPETEMEADFEEATPRPSNSQPANFSFLKGPPPPDRVLSSTSIRRSQPVRTGSMATVKLERQSRLADKLREIFDLPNIEEVRAEMPCWLLRSIRKHSVCCSHHDSEFFSVLQGYMYLTNSYLCFFAHMPSREVCRFLYFTDMY